MKKIVLLGYMGSGKSVVARLLAEILHLPYLDLDAIIEKKEDASITQIFDRQGEIKFRKLEHETFKQLMKNHGSFVLSLGGGTPCYANNNEFLNGPEVSSVYLKASIDTLHDRLISEKSQRPLIANMQPEEMKEFIAKSLFERSYYYNQAAFSIHTDNKTPEEIANEVKSLLV
jgi:shikimate kinase